MHWGFCVCVFFLVFLKEVDGAYARRCKTAKSNRIEYVHCSIQLLLCIWHLYIVRSLMCTAAHWMFCTSNSTSDCVKNVWFLENTLEFFYETYGNARTCAFSQFDQTQRVHWTLSIYPSIHPSTAVPNIYTIA